MLSVLLSLGGAKENRIPKGPTEQYGEAPPGKKEPLAGRSPLLSPG